MNNNFKFSELTSLALACFGNHIILLGCFSLCTEHLAVHTFTCRGMYVTYGRVLDWIMGFIATLYTQFVTTVNYSAIAISTLYISLLHTLVSSVFTSRILTTDS
jgi:hypothetical protein